MAILSSDRRSIRIGAFDVLVVLFFFFQITSTRADTREAIHQKILAGEQVSLNPSDPEATRTIDAIWIKEAALKHVRVEIYHAVIKGPLDAQDVTFEQRFTLGGCVIEGYADFSHAIFKRDFFTSNAIFRSWVSFQGAAFEHTATFQRTRFESSIRFDDAHFLETFDATAAYFLKDAGTVIFSQARFDGMANFALSRFDADASFISAQFGGEAYFPGARFGRRVEFERAHFVDVATFGSSPYSNRLSGTFVGKAYFYNAQFDSTADFDGVTFRSDVDFSNATFHALAAFSGTTFKALCEFSKTEFGNDGAFMGAKFLGPALFDSAHIAGSLYFKAQTPLPAATFQSDAQFTNAQAENIISFGGGNELARGVVFARKATFNMAKFRGLSDFQGVEFRGEASFLDATLGNDAEFIGATFDGHAVFDRVQFMGAALFSPPAGDVTSSFAQSARFTHNVSFSSAHFGAGARFNKVQFDEKADFGGVTFDGDAHFEDSVFLGTASFRSAVFRVVYFSAGETAGEQQFRDDVDLLGCTYDRIQVDWRSLLQYPDGRPRIQPYDRQPYIELEAALKRSGSEEDASAVYAERHRAESRKLTWFGKLWDKFYWLIANYGIDLSHEFYFALFFLGTGTLIFAHAGAVQTATGEETTIPWHQALPLAFHQFLPFGLPVKPSWTPSKRILYRYLWPFRSASAYANFLQIVGWVLIPLAAASLAGLLRHGPQ